RASASLRDRGGTDNASRLGTLVALSPQSSGPRGSGRRPVRTAGLARLRSLLAARRSRLSAISGVRSAGEGVLLAELHGRSGGGLPRGGGRRAPPPQGRGSRRSAASISRGSTSPMEASRNGAD